MQNRRKTRNTKAHVRGQSYKVLESGATDLV